jgi:hypothetical protein
MNVQPGFTPISLDALIAFGRSSKDQSWLDPLLHHLEQQFWKADLPLGKDQFGVLSKLLSDSINALRAEGDTVPQEISVALDHSFESSANDPITAQAAWCWGLILSRRILHTGGTEALHQMVYETSHDIVMMEAFFQETARLLCNGNPTLIAMIEESIQQLEDRPDKFVLGKTSDGFAKALATWKALPPPEAFDLRTFTYFPFHCDFLRILANLRKLDRGDYLSWLNRIQNPVAVHHVLLDKEITEDFGEFLSLFEEAPSAYSDLEDDGWTSLIAPILLEIALEHVRTALAPFGRAPRDEDAYKKLCDELSSRMEQLARKLQSRRDGPQLAAHWLLRLIRIKSLLHPWLALPASFATKAIIQVFGDSEKNAAPILNHLKTDFQLTDDERNALRASGKGKNVGAQTHKVDVLMARLLLKAHRSDTADYNEEGQVFEDVLLLRDPGLFDPNQNQSPTWRHHLASCTLNDADLACTWKRKWEDLSTQRLRAKNPMSTDDRSADEPSHFLCATAICRLENRPSLNRPENVFGLFWWDEVYRAIWFQVLFYSCHGEARSWRRLFVLLLGVLPKHMDLASEPGLEKLAEIWRSVGSDEELIIHTIAHLFRVGVEKEPLKASIALSGLDMEPILLRFESKGDNIHVYPLSEHWKQVNFTCREGLANS